MSMTKGTVRDVTRSRHYTAILVETAGYRGRRLYSYILVEATNSGVREGDAIEYGPLGASEGPIEAFVYRGKRKVGVTLHVLEVHYLKYAPAPPEDAGRPAEAIEP